MNLLCVISKLFEAIIDKKVGDHLNRNNYLNEKKTIRFCSSGFTADIFAHRINEMIDKQITRSIVLDISKVFDKV